MATRQGPRLRVESSCIGCDNLIPGGKRLPQCLAMARRMMPTTSPAPVWCPELPAARLALLVDLARTVCRKCGRTVEKARECYAIPTCFACLPPPPPLPVLPSFAVWQKKQEEVATGACSDCGDPLADPSTADECSIEHGAARGAGESEEPSR